MNRLLIPLILLTLSSYSQVCYETDTRSQAELYVYVTKWKSQADDIVEYTPYKQKAIRAEMVKEHPEQFKYVYWAKYLDREDPELYTVYFVKYRWRADRVWYIKKN